MAREYENNRQAVPQSAAGVKRRGLLHIGTLLSALTGASALSSMGADSAHAASGDKPSPNTYVPIAEKGSPSGVASLDMNATIVPTQLPDLSGTYAQKSRRAKSVKDFGAIGDGRANDTAAIQAVLDGGGHVFFPMGSYKVTATLIVPGNAEVNIHTGARVFAGAAIAGAIFKTPANFVRSIQFTGGGVIDCAELADTGIHLFWFAHVRITNLRIDSARVHGIKLGDAASGGRSAEAVIHGIHIFRLAPNQIPPVGNWGIFVENSGDHSISQVVIQSYRTGVFMASGTSSLHDVHVWHDPACGVHDTSFEDNGSGNVYSNCYADTPGSYGFRMRAFNSRIMNCMVYLNPAYANDNVVRGIRFEQPGPFATVMGNMFAGGDASHRLATDIEINGGDRTTMYIFGNQGSNVALSASAAYARVLGTRDLIFSDKGSLPAATSTLRGQVNMVRGGAGVADRLYICRKNATDGYEWGPLA